MALLLTLLLVGCDRQSAVWHGHDLTGVMPDLAFSLVDDNGHAVTASDYAGKTVLLYFGFTHCEDVCPTTLATLSRAVNALGADSRRVRILFVSVDPHRDTPAILQRYAEHFSPQVVALTGTRSQLDHLTRRYRVAYSYGNADARGDYEVYHSSAIFVFDARGKVRLLLQEQLGAAAITEDLQRLLSDSERSYHHATK